MKKTGLEIVEMIAEGEAPEKIKSEDKSIYIWNSCYSRYDLEKDNIVSLVLLDCLNDEFEIIEEDKVGKPKDDEDYHYISDDGNIITTKWKNIIIDRLRYEVGNCYKTFVEAQKQLEKIKIYTQLKRYAEEHNTEKIDWDNDKDKWFICYDYEDKKISVCDTQVLKEASQAYFTSDGLAEQAIKEIGEDNIKKLFEE